MSYSVSAHGKANEVGAKVKEDLAKQSHTFPIETAIKDKAGAFIADALSSIDGEQLVAVSVNGSATKVGDVEQGQRLSISISPAA